MVTSGAFRQALFYRIAVIPLTLPPLRERMEDLPDLVRHFMARACLLAKRTRSLSPEVMESLADYHWPGNLIQLQNVIERAYAMGVENAIGVEDLPDEIRTFGTISQMG